jgi:hypothetical protein
VTRLHAKIIDEFINVALGHPSPRGVKVSPAAIQTNHTREHDTQGDHHVLLLLVIRTSFAVTVPDQRHKDGAEAPEAMTKLWGQSRQPAEGKGSQFAHHL